jgi:hypothetical protein
VKDVTEDHGIVMVRTLVHPVTRQTKPSPVRIRRSAITLRAYTKPTYAIPAPIGT